MIWLALACSAVETVSYSGGEVVLEFHPDDPELRQETWLLEAMPLDGKLNEERIDALDCGQVFVVTREEQLGPGERLLFGETHNQQVTGWLPDEDGASCDALRSAVWFHDDDGPSGYGDVRFEFEQDGVRLEITDLGQGGDALDVQLSDASSGDLAYEVEVESTGEDSTGLVTVQWDLPDHVVLRERK